MERKTEGCDLKMEIKLKVERIENLEELKAIHRSLYADAVNLRSELDKVMPSILNIEAFAKSIHMNALKARDFDFFLVHRTIKEDAL